MPNQLLPGQRLNPGNSLFSINGYYELRYQQDGNLVLYDCTYQQPKALWDTGTGGRTACYVEYQTDGNFCVYAAPGDCVWDLAPRPLHPPINAIMQDDGNFVLYAITDVFDTTAMIAHAGGPQPAPRAPTRGVNIQQITQVAGAANVIQAIIDLF